MAKKLKEVVEQLKGAVVAHGKQAKVIENHIKEMKDGASMLGQLREKQSQDKANMEESKVEAQNAIIPEPSSNGTGSARPNFNMFAQNAIGGVMNGQQMGDMLFGQQKPQAPNMPPVDPMTQNNPDMGDKPVNFGGSMKQPRGTKEEMKARREEKKGDRLANKQAKYRKKRERYVEKRVDKIDKKTYRKIDKARKKHDEGKITRALSHQKINKASEKGMKMLAKKLPDHLPDRLYKY